MGVDWGNMAAGIGIGLNQGVKSLTEIQKMKIMNEQAEREQNKFEVWQQEEKRKATPIFTNRLKEVLDPEVYDTLYKAASVRGYLNNPGTPNEYIRTDRAEEFWKHVKDDKNLVSELGMARLKAAERKENELKSALEGASEKDAADLMMKLKQQQKETDNLKWGLESYQKQQENEAKKLTAAAALIKAQKESKWAHSGTTERGGLAVWENPETKEMVVRKPNINAEGRVVYSEEPFDPRKHGRLLGKTLSQTTVINQARENEKKFKPGTLDYMVELYEKDGKVPNFGMGSAAAGQRVQFWNKVSERARERGDSAAAQIARAAETKALQTSLNAQEKSRGMMGGFVRNLNKQIDRVDQIAGDIKGRVGVRALDMPIRELKTRFIGSGQEQVLNAYLMEISNEIGKLSTGSQASIAELSVEAQKRWSKVHDPSLSINELKKILNETRDMGSMRLDSVDDELAYTKEKLSGRGVAVSSGGVSGQVSTWEELKKKKGWK
jgi:hypothetical protein